MQPATIKNGRKAKDQFGILDPHLFPSGSFAKLSALPPQTAPQTPGGPGVNILIVDDTPENLVALEALLSSLGQNVVKAASGEEALRLLLKQDFAVIILDVNMPGLNGFETAAMIRQRKSSEHTPIIFVSAISTSDMHMFKGYSLGAVDYIFTPVIPEVLRSKVGVFVELLKKTNEIKEQSERLRRVEEKEHHRRLSEATERLDLETKRNRFFNLSIDLISIAGFDGFFKQLNPSWARTLGFSDPEFKKRPFLDFVHPEDRPHTQAHIETMRTKSIPVSFDNRNLCKDGSYRWFSWNAAPFQAEELIYLFGRDVTERKAAEEKIRVLNDVLEKRAAQLSDANTALENEIRVRNKAEEALKETNAELEAFSYSVSHDLRAPLRAMQAFAEALAQDYGHCLDDNGRDMTARIVMAASRMENLIQDLLIYSRISYGDLKPQTVDLTSVLEESCAHLEALIRDSKAKIAIEPPFFSVTGHFNTVVQIVSNLLSNALKFVAPGVQPSVRIRQETRENMGRLWVEDNGIGILPEYHARIFRVFERLHGTETYPGTGVGLAIARKGIDRMGGRIGLESTPNQGSKFWLELPLAK